jgi:hypothetical protein
MEPVDSFTPLRLRPGHQILDRLKLADNLSRISRRRQW